jgi:antitoxin VapB
MPKVTQRTVVACNVSTGVDTSGMKAVRAKLFQNGGSQAVRLPRDCRFPEGESEVVVRRVGRRVILEPVEEWPDEFLKSLGSLSAEIPRPKGVPITKLRDPFA